MRRSQLIISAAAVLLLAGSILALYLWPEKAPPDAQQEDPLPDLGDLIFESAEDVAEVLFFPREGTSYSIRRNEEDGWLELYSPEALFPGNHNILDFLFRHSTTLADLPRVTGDAGDGQLELFGLDEPLLVWQVDRTDGTSARMELGGRVVTVEGGLWFFPKFCDFG